MLPACSGCSGRELNPGVLLQAQGKGKVNCVARERDSEDVKTDVRERDPRFRVAAIFADDLSLPPTIDYFHKHLAGQTESTTESRQANFCLCFSPLHVQSTYIW